MMRDKYCLPIITDSQQAVTDTITQNLDSYAFFEVWLDYINDEDDAFIRRLSDILGERLILVFRRQLLEPMHLDVKRRLEILSLINDTPTYADLDIESQTAELEYCNEPGVTIQSIASHHNYKRTPSNDTLRHIIQQMTVYKPTIVKIATTCSTPDDALRLLRLLLNLQSQGKRCIILGMGEQGLVTRIFGTLWGNEVTFVPLSPQQSSAPGQLTREQFDNLAVILEGHS